MATLDELYAYKSALLKALGSGVSEVKHGDKSVRYRDIADVRAALADIEEQIKKAEGASRRRVLRLYPDKGL